MDPVVINEEDPSAWVDHLDPYREGHRGLSSEGHHRDLDWEDHHRGLERGLWVDLRGHRSALEMEGRRGLSMEVQNE